MIRFFLKGGGRWVPFRWNRGTLGFLAVAQSVGPSVCPSVLSVSVYSVSHFSQPSFELFQSWNLVQYSVYEFALTLYWGFTSLQRYFSHIATWKQEITNLWKFKWRGWESNPGPLSPQAKSLTTRPLLLLSCQHLGKICITLLMYDISGNFEMCLIYTQILIY